jgi:serine/threonine-protein kinase
MSKRESAYDGATDVLPAGAEIDGYVVQRHLASGGMADIYLVSNGARTVALKQLRRRYRGDWHYRQMLIDEAGLMKRLSHRNVVCALDTSAAHRGYFTMEYVHGEPLSSVAAAIWNLRGAFPIPLAVFIVARVADALHHAHQLTDEDGAPRNVVHRDVSMANILVGYDGVVKVVDFGVAKSTSREAHTQTGYLKGNIGYMSPEQVVGGELDRRSDVFSAGIVLWELLVGKRLFHADNDYARMHQIVHCPITPPSVAAPRLSRELDAVVLRALAKDRAQRYSTAKELLVDLAAITRDSLIASPKGLAAAMSGLFAPARQAPSNSPAPVAKDPSLVFEYDGRRDRPTQRGLGPPKAPDSATLARRSEASSYYDDVQYGEQLSPLSRGKRMRTRHIIRTADPPLEAVEDCPNRDDIAAFFASNDE